MPLQHWRLSAFLTGQPADVRSVTLTLAEVAELLGGPLPVAARGLNWWSVRPKAEQRSGWRIGYPHITPAGWVVTFRRLPPDTSE